MFLTDLTDDVLLNIISFISYTDFPVVSCLSKRFFGLCKNQLKARTVLVNSNYEENDIGFFVEQDVFTKQSTIDLSYAKMLMTVKSYLPNIRYLCITSSVRGICDKNVHLIGEYLPHLYNLCLYAVHASDEGLSRLFSKCQNLRILSLVEANVTGECFSSLPPLISVNITHSGQMFQKFDGFDRLSQSLISFEADIPGNTSLRSRQLFKSFKKMKKFAWTINRQKDLEEVLNSVSMYGKLDELVLRINRDIDNNELQWMQDFSSLKSLSLYFRYSVSVDKLLQILYPCNNINTLRLQIFHLMDTSENPITEETELLLKVVNAIKQLQNLEKIDFEMRRDEPYRIKLNKCFEWMFEHDRFKEISFGYLIDEEVNAIIDVLRTVQKESQKRYEIDLRVQTDSLIHIPLDIHFNLRARRRRFSDMQSLFTLCIKRKVGVTNDIAALSRPVSYPDCPGAGDMSR